MLLSRIVVEVDVEGRVHDVRAEPLYVRAGTDERAFLADALEQASKLTRGEDVEKGNMRATPFVVETEITGFVLPGQGAN